jgi:hypothetical protein
MNAAGIIRRIDDWGTKIKCREIGIFLCPGDC